MLFKNSALFLTFVYLFICVNAELSIEKNIAGQCVLLEDCNSAKKDVLNMKYPQVCGFQGLVPIVCCPFHQPGLIAEKKCWEYGESVYKIMPSQNVFISNEPVNISTCTITNLEQFPSGDGCLKAKDKEFPHMVVLGYGRANYKKWQCAGTLISNQFILTAAHCLNFKNYGEVKFIRLGELNLAALNDADPQDFYVKEIFKHPNYLAPSRYNDIALLKMDRPARFNDFIRPACLHVTKDIPANKFMVTGWNQIEVDGEKQSERLQKINKHGFSHEECNNAYSVTRNPNGFYDGINPESQICAISNKQSDLCEMDAGGPLQMYHPKAHCMYSVIGINSLEPFILNSNTPDVYTRVSHYIDWIEQIVWL